MDNRQITGTYNRSLHQQLDIYKKDLHRLAVKESRQHGELTTDEYYWIDYYQEQIQKLEQELNVDKPKPVVIPLPSKARIEAIKAKLRRCGYNLAEGKATYHVKDTFTVGVQEVHSIDPETYCSQYKDFKPRQHKNAMEYNRETDTYELKRPSNFRYK